MTRFRPALTITLLAALSLAAARIPAAQAQTASPGPAIPAPSTQGGSDAAMTQAIEQRIAALQLKLAITPAEMPDWTNFAAAMRANAVSTNKLFEQRAQSTTTMTAVQNMRSYAVIARDYADNTGKLADAFETLYGKLTPDQQKTADSLFRAPAAPSTAQAARH